MKWIGPYTIDNLLEGMMNNTIPKPPESQSVYLISLKPWVTEPTAACDPLYVGSNTGKSKRFRTRVGDLIADAFGFFSAETGHHSGGQSINAFCMNNSLNFKSLFIGWAEQCECVRCGENNLFESLVPRLNKNRPSACSIHENVNESIQPIAPKAGSG
jgi:hypothetical protein